MRDAVRVWWIACLTLALAAGPVLGGTYFESRTENETLEGQGGPAGFTMVTRGWVEGPSAKILFTQSDNPIMAEGGYLLTTDGGETIFFVDPEERTYMEWSMGKLLGNAAAMMESMGGMMKMDFEEHEVEKLAEEPGPPILGYPTTYYEYETSYVMTMQIMGMSQRMETSQHQEIWATQELKAPGFGAWLRKTPPKTGMEGLDEMFAEEMEKGIEGFPLRRVTQQTTTDQRGQTTRSRATTEVTVIREEPIPADTFELPSGYAEKEMPDLTTALPQQP